MMHVARGMCRGRERDKKAIQKMTTSVHATHIFPEVLPSVALKCCALAPEKNSKYTTVQQYCIMMYNTVVRYFSRGEGAH